MLDHFPQAAKVKDKGYNKEDGGKNDSGEDSAKPKHEVVEHSSNPVTGDKPDSNRGVDMMSDKKISF